MYWVHISYIRKLFFGVLFYAGGSVCRDHAWRRGCHQWWLCTVPIENRPMSAAEVRYTPLVHSNEASHGSIPRRWRRRWRRRWCSQSPRILLPGGSARFSCVFRGSIGFCSEEGLLRRCLGQPSCIPLLQDTGRRDPVHAALAASRRAGGSTSGGASGGINGDRLRHRCHGTSRPATTQPGGGGGGRRLSPSRLCL